jgi:hypothetical protein
MLERRFRGVYCHHHQEWYSPPWELEISQEVVICVVHVVLYLWWRWFTVGVFYGVSAHFVCV